MWRIAQIGKFKEDSYKSIEARTENKILIEVDTTTTGISKTTQEIQELSPEVVVTNTIEAIITKIEEIMATEVIIEEDLTLITEGTKIPNTEAKTLGKTHQTYLGCKHC